MSNLQTIAKRCPVMGKALAVQSSKLAGLNGSQLAGIKALKGIRGFGTVAGGKEKREGREGERKLHTSSEVKARPIDGIILGEKRKHHLTQLSPTSQTNSNSSSDQDQAAGRFCTSPKRPGQGQRKVRL